MVEQSHQDPHSSQEPGLWWEEKPWPVQSAKARPSDMPSPAPEASLSLHSATIWDETSFRCSCGVHLVSRTTMYVSHLVFHLLVARSLNCFHLLVISGSYGFGVHLSVQIIATSSVQHPSGNSCFSLPVFKALSAVHSCPWPAWYL